MIIYFANRQMQILGSASTNLPSGYIIEDDSKKESIENGITTFECKVSYNSSDRVTLEDMAVAGNYILSQYNGIHEFYQILESEFDTESHSVLIYGEDAGLDLLNTIAPAYKPTKAMTAAEYIDLFIPGGWQIGVNEMSTEKLKLPEWEGESNVIERIQSIANSFGECEISFSYRIKEGTFNLVGRYIDIYQHRGEPYATQQYRLNYEVASIVTKKSIADVATAFNCTGKVTKRKTVTLAGYTPEDPDFYVDGKLLICRSAAKRWAGELDTDGIIVRQYSYDTDKQSELCNHAIAELKKVVNVKEEYTVEFLGVQPFHIGDRINIVDVEGNLFLDARVLEYELSVTGDTTSATLGDYVHRTSGINASLTALSDRLQSLIENGYAQDAVTIKTTSSNGNIFKAAGSTTLSATVYVGVDKTISTQEELTELFGSTAVIRWYKNGTLAGTGFTLSVDVNETKAVYTVKLEVDQ